jgi:protein ImuB
MTMSPSVLQSSSAPQSSSALKVSQSFNQAVRTLAVWGPDWPVIAAGGQPDRPAAVVGAGRVLVCSAAARLEGVRRGQRLRDAQSRCPELQIHQDDPSRDARAFEPVAACVENLIPGIEIVRPGLLVVAARGAARYYDGELALLAKVARAVADETGSDVQLGIADGIFAATRAAYAAAVVPAGEVAGFLAGLSVGVLERPELADLLVRLGVRSLGEYVALPRADVLTRFGPDAAYAHDLAHGVEYRPPTARHAPPDLAVEMTLDPPVERVDTATFVAKTLAEQLHEKMTWRGMACIRISIEARTEHGELLFRSWRHGSALTAGFTATAIADRTRWQLDGWLSGSIGSGRAATNRTPRPSAGLVFLRLVPEEVIYDDGRQLALWGGDFADAGTGGAGSTRSDAERIERALARIQGMLGPDAVVTAVLGAGREPAEQVQLVPWGELPDAPVGAVAAQPWPGRLPAPSPSTVLSAPWPLEVSAIDGTPVDVGARGVVTAAPAFVNLGQPSPGRRIEIVGWAGPWLLDVRWWDRLTMRRRARFQVALADGTALLLACDNGRWSIEAVYD